MRFREHGEDPPSYVMYPSEECGMFSVEVLHNGFFCGLRHNLEYVSATISHFDNLTVDTWSLTWINQILRILGHERDERTSVYWLLPDKDLRDGLVLVEFQSHIRDMINASKYHKTLVLFVDHTNFMKGLRPDVIVGQRPAPRPAQASPMPAPSAPRPAAAAPIPSQSATLMPAPSAPRPAAAAPIPSQSATPVLAPSAPRPATPAPIPSKSASPMSAPSAPRPAAATPAKAFFSSSMMQTIPATAESSRSSSLVVAQEADMQFVESDGSASDDDDFEFYDSDFDAEDGDDDLFADNVDKSVNDNNEQELCVENEYEDALEDDTLDLETESRQHLMKSIKAFNPEVDMDNPTFKIGMVFSGVGELRKAVTTYAIRNRVKVKKLRNERRRYEAICAPGCTWRIKASGDPRRTGGFIITEYEGTHECEGSFPVSAITAKVLTEKFMHEFRDNQKIYLKSFAAKVLREFKMCPKRWKLSRARKAALLKIHGDEEGQFRQLLDYGQELRRSNPGSKFFVTTNSVGDPESSEHKEHLATVYWSYDACKPGFLAGCRPFICLDGCHIKTKYKGVLLTTIGIDPNDCIFPIAFGLVEVECTVSWEWFLTNLRDDLNITNTAPWTIMSDKQKGLINAVQKVFPDAEHRFCVRHMIQNFQRAGHRGETLKNDIWAIARSTSVPKWKRSMDNLKVDNEKAYSWIEELVPSQWIKAFFSEFPKCDMLLNNHSEVFNSYILEAREMPFLSMLETMFYKILQRTESKQKEAEKMTGRICPKIKKKLDKFFEWSGECIVTHAGNFLYSVSSHEFEKDYTIDFNARTCDCKRWQLTGIPCHHVIACCRKDRINPENLVHSCYTVDAFNKAYAYKLAPDFVDHAWSFRLADALKQLREVPGLAERMAALMCVDLDGTTEAEDSAEQDSDKSGSLEHVLQVVEKEKTRIQEKGSDFAAWLELEELGIDDDMLVALNLSANFPNLVALNLWGNKLQDPEKVLQEIRKCGSLKALWLNENPVLNQGLVGKCGLVIVWDIPISLSVSVGPAESFAVGVLSDLNAYLKRSRDYCFIIFGHAAYMCVDKGVLDALPELEIYNSHFTSKAKEWALGFCGDMVGAENPCLSVESISLENVVALDLSDRSIHKLPEVFSSSKLSSLSNLNIRGNPLDQVSGEDLLKLFSGFTHLQELEVDIPGPLGNSAISIVESLPNLALLNGVGASNIVESGKHVVDSALKPRLPEWSPEESLAERVIGAMWLYLMTYRLADGEKLDETPIWYVMDELASAMRHSDGANFRIAPFLFMPEGKLASAVSYTILWPICDVHIGEECTRDFLFGIGEDKQRSARLTAWFHTPENYFIQEFKKYQEQLESTSICPSTKETPSTKSVRPSDGRALRVLTDISQVEEFLTRPEFVLTTDPQDADIIWLGAQVDSELKSSLGLTDQQYTNQFPYEACLVMKHHLADTIHKAWGSPEWLQPTYNLETHLSQLIGDYCVRKRDGMDNLWIMKPWNMARTIDTTVSGDLSAIIRLIETGPKICQKYIEHPALFQGRKFDLRYIVLVRSICPLDIFLTDVFWVRLANNQYTLEKTSLFEYETHFTVMNYTGKMNHMNTPEFVKEFEKEHQVKWLEIHENIRNMIRRVFESASAVHPEMQNTFSRAIYGVDVMLDNTFKPKILEVTYCPDCTRACQYDTRALVGSQGPIRGSDFFNTVFGCLFLDDLTNVSPL